MLIHHAVSFDATQRCCSISLSFSPRARSILSSFCCSSRIRDRLCFVMTYTKRNCRCNSEKNNNRQQNIKHNSNVIENTLTFRCDTFWCARLLSFLLNWISIDWSQIADWTKSSILISCRLKSTGDVEFYQFQKCNNVSQTRIIIKTKKREKKIDENIEEHLSPLLFVVYTFWSVSVE